MHTAEPEVGPPRTPITHPPRARPVAGSAKLGSHTRPLTPRPTAAAPQRMKHCPALPPPRRRASASQQPSVPAGSVSLKAHGQLGSTCAGRAASAAASAPRRGRLLRRAAPPWAGSAPAPLSGGVRAAAAQSRGVSVMLRTLLLGSAAPSSHDDLRLGAKHSQPPPLGGSLAIRAVLAT